MIAPVANVIEHHAGVVGDAMGLDADVALRHTICAGHRNAARPRVSVNNAAKMHSTDLHLQPNQIIEHCTVGRRT